MEEIIKSNQKLIILAFMVQKGIQRIFSEINPEN